MNTGTRALAIEQDDKTAFEDVLPYPVFGPVLMGGRILTLELERLALEFVATPN